MTVSAPGMKVGLILPMTEHDDGGMRPYREVRELARHGEAAGLDSLWVCDHMLFRHPDSPTRGTWEAATFAAAVCEATSQAQVGTLVMCTAFRNPVLLAKTAVTLDEISDGRLILGLGAGWHTPEMTALGLPTEELVSRFEESVTVTLALLRDGHVDFRGRYFTIPDCELRPRGPRPGQIPVLIGGEGPRLMRVAARLADGWNTAWHKDTSRLDERLETFASQCRRTGRDTAAIDATVGLDVTRELPDDTRSTEDLLRVLSGLRQRGVRHVVCDLKPLTPDTVAWLADTVASDRKNAVKEDA
ncbi:LLM class flavin-dependent oxidoreductase [Streptomyces sp. NPDC096013]|uniref:LLM class flavin-dependent oxidoreductase n=1 Tax=Streptomyces sp. NPDC096013 TaxID=3366069 RepID=UPI0038227D3A